MAPGKALLEIKEFLAGFTIDVNSPDFSSQNARQLYRRFHAVLLWEIPVDHDEIDATIRLYSRECLADLASSYMLTLMGGYKAARLGLRGAIENAIRVFTAASGQDVLVINSVYDLVESCKSHWATTPLKVQTLTNLYSLYGDLCKTVHSSSVDYMSLRVPFETIMQFDKNEFARNASLIDSTLKSIGEGYFIQFHQLLHKIDFKNADYIRDSIEADIKSQVA